MSARPARDLDALLASALLDPVDGLEVVGASRLPGVAFDPSSKGAQAYIAFGAEMVERVKSF